MPLFPKITRKIVKSIVKAYGLTDLFSGLTEIQKGIVYDQAGVGNLHENVAIANMCACLVSSNVANIPVRLEDNEGEPIPDDPKFKLLMESPNFLYTGFELIEFLTLGLIYNGNAYTQVIGFDNVAKNDPRALWPMFPKYVEPRMIGPTLTEDTLKYIYRPGGKEETFSYQEIIHSKEANPGSHISGLSWVVAASGKTKYIKNLEDYQINLINNGTWPSINVHGDIDITDEQIKVLEANIAKFKSGVDNAGKILTTTGGLKASVMSFSPTDMEILMSEKLTLATVAAIMRVPAELLGPLMDKKNVATYREAMTQFYYLTLIPTAERIYREFNRAFWPEGDRKIVVNVSAIPALRPTTEQLTGAFWYSPNHKRVMQGAAPSDDPLMDKIYMPGTYIPIEDLGEVPEEKPAKEM